MSANLKALLICAVVGGLIVWGFSAWERKSQATDAEVTLKIIDRLEREGLPNLSMSLFKGGKLQVSELSDKVVLINFWASWCSPCLDEFPSMVKLVKELNGKMVLIAISQDTQESEIQAFLKAFPEVENPNVHIVWDREKELAKQFNVDRLPESFLTDSKGKLAKKIIGSIQWYTPDSIKYVNGLIR